VRRVPCKKIHNFTQLFDLQARARAQIFKYKDVSVCNVTSPNFYMFYDKRRVVSRRGQWFLVVSRSSWPLLSVFFVISRSSRMAFIFYGGYAHVFTETYGWGKLRSVSGQMYGG